MLILITITLTLFFVGIVRTIAAYPDDPKDGLQLILLSMLAATITIAYGVGAALATR